jgi:hypothetical protein
MAVAVQMDFKGDLNQYEQVIQKMGFSHGGHGAPGGLFHWVTPTDGGFHITDVWQDQETFERFAQEQIGPYAEEAGLDGPHNLSVVPVHNYLTAGPGQ